MISKHRSASRKAVRGLSWLVALVCLAALAVPAQGASGTWDRAWGRNVDSAGGSGSGEICTVATNCQLGSTLTALGGEMYLPNGVATDAAGNVYVADTNNYRIEKFDSAGTFLRAWGKDVVTGGGTGFEICTAAADCQGRVGGGLGGEMNLPAAVATDTAGNVYVADTSNHRIQKFDSAGNFVRAWGKDVVTGGGTGFEICTAAAGCKAGVAGGGLGGEMNGLTGVATDTAGNVYVADYFNHRIQKFDPSGNFAAAWGKDVVTGGGTGLEICTVDSACKIGVAGGLGGEMNGSAGVATDTAGNVFVADLFNHRIQKFDSAGNFAAAWGKDVVTGGGTGFEICTAASACKIGVAGGLGGEMNFPNGVATDAARNVYVAENANNRIQKFDSAGNFAAAWGKDVVTGGGTGFEICTAASGCKPGVAGGLGGEMNGPRGVAADAAGNVYLADWGNNRIQKFADPPTATGKRAAALKRCKKKFKKNRDKKRFKKCKRGANKLPV